MRAGYLLLGFPLTFLLILTWVSFSAPSNELSPAAPILMIIAALPVAVVLVAFIAFLLLLVLSVITLPFDRWRIRRRLKQILASDRDGLVLPLMPGRQLKEGLEKLGLPAKRAGRFLIVLFDEKGIEMLDHRTVVAQLPACSVSRFTVDATRSPRRGRLVAHIRVAETEEHALTIGEFTVLGRWSVEELDRKRDEIRKVAEAAIRGRPITLSS